MADSNIRKNPFEDQIIQEIAEMVAGEMRAEIEDEVAVWVEKLPITSTKVRRTDVTRAFQERFAKQLAERAEQIALRRGKDLHEIPTGHVGKEIAARETQAVLEKEGDFLAHVLQCARLASKIAMEKAAFEEEDDRIVQMVEREMDVVLRADRERWMEMGKVSEAEFEKESGEKFGKF